MKIAILHHDLEWSEKEFKKYFEKKGIQVNLFDVRKTSIKELLNYKPDLVMNRIYASVANRDYSSIKKTLNLIDELEANGIPCLNSGKTSFYDYNKFDSYKIMKKNNIFTPETLFIGSKDSLNSFIDDSSRKFNFPMIIKRNTGGRIKDISKVNSKEELRKNLLKKFELAEKEDYRGGFIAQEFIESSRKHDCRIGIINNKFAFSYSRSLISLEDDEKVWLASTSKGSVEKDYPASNQEINQAIKASKIIGAKFNELDIMFTDKGPCVIESNPTPNYFVSSPDDGKRMEIFVNILAENLNHKKEVCAK